MRKIKYIVVHCSAGRQTQNALDIINYHTSKKGLGWKVPGYHFIIEPDGFTVNAVPVERVSNGVKGFNSVCINICYIGGIDFSNPDKPSIDNRTPQQKDALRKLLTRLKKLFPQAKIQGHRDFSPDLNGNGVVDAWERIKDCPCFDAIEEYKDI